MTFKLNSWGEHYTSDDESFMQPCEYQESPYITMGEKPFLYSVEQK